MIGLKVRVALVALAVLSLSSSSAQACDLWHRWFGAPTTTFYAPYTASYAPAGCGQTVNYMPQTCYRTVYVNAPVVSYRPVSSCDPCTGCATTVMRPVVSYAMQARLVPYTTYRPVITAAPAAACCGAVTPATSYYVPAYAAPTAISATYAAPVAAAPAPGCCGTSAAPALVPNGTPGATVPSLAPSLNYPPATAAPPSASAYPLSPTPPAATYPPSTTPPAATAAPNGGATPPPAAAPQNKTFENTPEQNKPAPESRLLLPPRTEPSSTGGIPRGLDPEVQDRVTAIPLHPTWSIRTASAIRTARPIEAKQVNPEWRSARP